MMKNLSESKIYFGIGTAFIILTVCLITVVFFYSDEWIIRGYIISFSLLFVLLGFILILLVKKMVISFTTTLSECIDNMINDNMDVSFELESETLTAKLQTKLKRLYEIMLRNGNQMKLEKQLLQEAISDISHQVKTPVANLKMYNTNLLEQKLPLEKEREFLISMESQINKLDFLILSMVKISRLETGIITLCIQDLPIYNTIALALGGIVLPAEKKNIDITVFCEPSFIVPHDKKWTGEALFNLLENAVKYTEYGGKISVIADKWEMYTKIDISDTGKGIAEQNLAQIFKRFYREEDVHDIDGVGIGLFLCRNIINRQGGYIQVKSEIGKGSTFSVFLPNERQL